MAPTRRRFLLGAGATAATLLAGCLGDRSPTDASGPGPGSSPTDAPGSPSSTDTPTPTNPGTGTGSDEPPVTTTAPTADAVRWRRSVGSPMGATPVVADGAVFSGTNDGVLQRHVLDSGSEDWSVEVSRPVQDLLPGDGALLALSGTFELGSNQTVHAVDAASGRERWTFSPTGWWYELLATRDGTAYVSTADDAVGGSGETLYALSLADGTEQWQAPIGDPREGVVTADSVYVSSYGRMQGFDRADGTELWNNEVRDETLTTLGAVGDAVVYAYQAEESDVFSLLVGVDAASGSERWRFDAWGVTTTAVRDGTVYVGGGGVAALDPADGSVLWESDTPGYVADAGVTDARVYGGGDTVQAYAREDGELLWEWTPDPSQGGVLPAGVTSSTLYLDAYRDADPRNRYKFAVDVASGEQQWAFEDGTQLSDLAVGTDAVVTAGANGRLYALE